MAKRFMSTGKSKKGESIATKYEEARAESPKKQVWKEVYRMDSPDKKETVCLEQRLK